MIVDRIPKRVQVLPVGKRGGETKANSRFVLRDDTRERRQGFLCRRNRIVDAGTSPLVIAENERFVAIATEEIALRRSLGRDFEAREPAPGTMRVWAVNPAKEASRASASAGV